MRLLIYIKTTLRGMVANGVITLLYFIGFPIILAGFMGFIQGSMHDTPLKISKIEMNIIDEDKSDMSKELINFIKSEQLSEFIMVVDDESGKADILIPKGYEESLLSKNKNTLTITQREDGEIALSTLEIVLDKYHQGVYVGLSGGSQEDFNKIQLSETIENVFIDKKASSSSYQYFASSMIAFVITMLVYGTIMGGNVDISKNLEKRTLTAPISRRTMFFYDYIAYLCYTSIIIGAYVLVFRIAGIAFGGDILSLIVLVLASATLVSSLITFVHNVFPEKLATVIGFTLFVLPIIGMEMFGTKGNVIAKFAPTHYVSKAFESYTVNGSLVGIYDYVFYILAGSLILFLITTIKESIVKGAKKCV